MIEDSVHHAMGTVPARRPLKSRDTGWAKALAGLLLRWRVSPNAISIASVFFAAGAGAALYFSAQSSPAGRALLLALAAAGIQLRLLCNLMDGMVAVEGGLQTKAGEVYNDLPDRVADVVIFVAAGYAVRGWPGNMLLGWSAALLAVFTAYVRLLGGAAGLKQSFIGPMAKPHRMATLTVACLLSMVETQLLRQGTLLWIALIVIDLGCLATIVRRTRRIVAEMESR
jgi:phosphatidylglycerophosphate synthase